MDSELLLIFGGVGVAIAVFVVMERMRRRAGVYGDGAARRERPREREEGETSSPRAPMPSRTPLVAITDWGGVLFESGPEKLLLIVLPSTTVTSEELIRPTPEMSSMIDAAIVVNDEKTEGNLWGSAVIERLGIDRSKVYATSPSSPIDRGVAPAEKPRKANQLPKRLRTRNLTIRNRGPGVLELTWRSGGELKALVGAGIPIDAFHEPPHPQMVLGSISLPTSSDFKAPALDCLMGMQNITLIRGVPPDTVDKMTTYWTSLGVGVKVVDTAGSQAGWVGDAVELVEALESDDLPRVRELLEAMDAKGAEMSLISLAARGETTTGLRLAELALDVHGDMGELLFQRGVMEFMSGDLESAEASYRQALESDSPYPLSACNLAAILLDRGDIEDARTMADRALEANPDDALCLQAALVTRATAGDREGALELIAERGEVLGDDERVAIEDALKNDEVFKTAAERPLVHRFPLHAKLMLDMGRKLLDESRAEEALEPLKRARELDPASLEAATDLGCVLSDLGRDDEAIACYDKAIAETLGGDLLRFNRGNAKHRLERYEEALADYERCHELLPDWLDPGVNIVATLQALDRIEDALERVDELERDGAAPELIDQLREQLETHPSHRP